MQIALEKLEDRNWMKPSLANIDATELPIWMGVFVIMSLRRPALMYCKHSIIILMRYLSKNHVNVDLKRLTQCSNL